MDWDSIGLGVGSYIGFHLLLLGLLTWVTGERFLLPSLGPSIFALATLPNHEMHLPRRFVGGQFIGASAAFIATELLLGGLTPGVPTHPFSAAALQQILTTFVAALLATIGMYLTKTQHPPAYATTLIISLGFITNVIEIGVFVVAVLVTITVHEILSNRLQIWNLPYEYEL